MPVLAGPKADRIVDLIRDPMITQNQMITQDPMTTQDLTAGQHLVPTADDIINCTDTDLAMSLHVTSIKSTEDKYYKENDIIDEFTIQNMLGEGRYGIVYLAVDKEKNKYVIKQLKNETIKKDRNKLYYEEMTLKKLQNPYFPKFITGFKDEDREGYILEFIEGKVFEDILRKDKYQFNREEIYELCSQLLDVLEIMHECNIVHRDIRLPNVIRKGNNELALIDFGLARIIDDYYTREIDYWYLGDFLLHLYYTTYQKKGIIEKPWFKELDLSPEEKVFLRKLLGIDKNYKSISQIREQLNKIKNCN